MAETENAPISETTSASTPNSVEAPTEPQAHEGASASAALTPADGTPFHDDQLLFFDGAPIRNELADAQAEPAAARSLAARHWSRLLYDPNAPWRGRAPYPQVSAPKPEKPSR